MNIPAEKFRAARKAESIRISTSGFDERLALSSMSALLETMDKCIADLRRVWNISDSGEPHPAIKKWAKGNLRRLFESDDYPTQAIIEDGTGSVKVVVLINEEGRVADCSVVETSGLPVLDAQACAVITERALFKPAVDLDGKPAKSAYYQRITWRLQ